MSGEKPRSVAPVRCGYDCCYLAGIMTRILLLILLGALTVAPAKAQGFRPPELNVQFHRAHTAWATGNSLLEAKARIDRVLAALPEDVEALKLRAAIQLDLDRPEEALKDADHAALLAPDNGEAHLLRCEAASRTGALAEAENALELASNLFLQRIDHYVRLSACALTIEAFTRAESLARVAVAQDDTDPRGHIQLARVFMATNRSDAARAVVSRMIESSRVTRTAVMADSQLALLFTDETLRQD